MNDGQVNGIEADAGHSLPLVADVLVEERRPPSGVSSTVRFCLIILFRTLYLLCHGQINRCGSFLQPKELDGFQIWALTGPVHHF